MQLARTVSSPTTGGCAQVVRAGALDRFQLLASAIAGRTVDVVEGEAGDGSWSDGSTIFVDPHATGPGALRAIAVQASLISAGSFDPDVISKLRRRDTTIRRYLALEGHRALGTRDLLLPPAARALIDPATADRSDSAARSLEIASGRDPVDDPPSAFGVIHPSRVRAMRVPEFAAPSREVRAPTQAEVLEQLDEDDPGPTIDLDIFTIEGGGGAIGKLLKRFLGDGRSKGGGAPSGDGATHWTRRNGRGRRPKRASSSQAAAEAVQGLEHLSERPLQYPEWDVYREQYRPRWCTVRELPVDDDSQPPLALPDPHALRRPLGRLGMELERHRRQRQGGEIDIDGVVEAQVELAAGVAPPEAIYVDTLRTRRDLSVLVLLDISGSAGEPSTTGSTVHEHQRLGAGLLTVALHQLGDRVALYGFRSQGRGNIEILPVKRFDDELGESALRRLAGLQPCAYTRLGAAIRHGTKVVVTDGGTARRMLVVVSDGFAYDHAYESDYGEADARRSLAEARRQGVACLCLSIGADTDAASLRRVFGTAAHAVIPRADQLPAMVGPLFRSALRMAEAQRRISQRRERTRERHELERRTA